MSQELVVQTPPALVSTVGGEMEHIPALVAGAGPQAAMRFVEFFTANIRNVHTRRAYHRAVVGFFDWCELQGLDELGRILPIHHT